MNNLKISKFPEDTQTRKKFRKMANIASCLEAIEFEVNSLGLKIPSTLLGATVLDLKQELQKNGYSLPSLPRGIFQDFIKEN